MTEFGASQSDPELDRTFEIFERIKKEYKRKRNQKMARTDALEYAKTSLNYAKTHPGQIYVEYFDENHKPVKTEDQSEIDIRNWGEAISDAENGNWEKMKIRMKEKAEIFYNDDPKGPPETPIFKALTNLANSI